MIAHVAGAVKIPVHKGLTDEKGAVCAPWLSPAGSCLSRCAFGAGTLRGMKTSLLDQALDYHYRLPGLLRATLNDYGLDDLVIDEHMLGWDGKQITRPVFDCDGLVVEIKRYELAEDGNLGKLIEHLTW